MNYIYSMIKADYQQRTRNYSFLITLAITVFATYSFIPSPDASYTTFSIGKYQGIHNSAWVGHVTALMTTVMLSLYGFFLVNSGIKKDIETQVGQLIAITPITNFHYLTVKLLSNFLLLFTISAFTFLISIALFLFRSQGYAFNLTDFAIPFLLLPLPAIFVVSAIAVAGEVFLPKSTVLQSIVYIFLYGTIASSINNSHQYTKKDAVTDLFGSRTVTNSILNTVNTQFQTKENSVNIGYLFNNKIHQSFEWKGMTWPAIFIFSRLLWIAAALLLVYISSFFFHRFDFEQRVSKKSKTKDMIIENLPVIIPEMINRAALPAIKTAYGIFPFIKIELLLLIRKGSVWLWVLNAGAWISLCFIPVSAAHLYVLPILWFLQVTRLSDLATKEKTNRLHYFTYASYKPLLRMLPAQILAGTIGMLVLALPVIIRYLISGDLFAAASIINGAAFIVLLAVAMGIVSDGNKLFEIVFFLLTYAVIQKIPGTAYLGTVSANEPATHLLIFLLISASLAVISFAFRSYQTRHL